MGLVTRVKLRLSCGRLERGLGAGDVGLGLGHGARALVQFFLRHGAALPKPLHARRFDAGERTSRSRC